MLAPRDAEHGSGLGETRWAAVVVPALRGGLALSDLVVVCGEPELSVQPGGGLRLEPTTGLLPLAGDQLHAHCEIYHLAPGADGHTSFEYVCTVTSSERGRPVAFTLLVSSLLVATGPTLPDPAAQQTLDAPVAGVGGW